jgi:hypothetical protein
MTETRLLTEEVGWYVEVAAGAVDWRYGPYPRLADAEAVRARLVAVLAQERLAGVTARPGLTSPAGGKTRPRPVQARLL